MALKHRQSQTGAIRPKSPRKTSAASPPSGPSYNYQDVGLSVVLAIQASIMFVVGPLAATGILTPMVMDGCRFALATAAVVLVTKSRPVRVAIGLTFLVSLVLGVMLRGGATALSLYQIGVTTLFDAAVAAAVTNLVFQDGRVTIHRILGAVILYLSIGLLFANAYRACALLLHPSFSGLPSDRRAALGQLLYFSLGALTSNGSADLTPLHPLTRSLTNMESVIGQLFPPTLLARLVTLHAAHNRKDGV